jgi:AcrR family transcriptional regulator
MSAADLIKPIDLGVRRAARRDPAHTRARLVEAGTELFAELGLHPVTSAAIARHAGVATGTFYLHFPDKLALFRAIVQSGLADLRARQDAAGARHAPGSEAELRARIEALLDFADEKRALMRVVFARGADSAGIAEEIAGVIAPGIERRYAAQQFAGTLNREIHVGLAAQMRAAALVRAMAWWSEDPARVPREAVAATVLRLDPSFRAPQPHDPRT